MAQQTYHLPVLPEQTIDALGIRPDGIYLDGTAGGGGHSHAIASRLTTGRLVSLDQDPDAIAAAAQAASLYPPQIKPYNRSFISISSPAASCIFLPALPASIFDVTVTPSSSRSASISHTISPVMILTRLAG